MSGTYVNYLIDVKNMSRNSFQLKKFQIEIVEKIKQTHCILSAFYSGNHAVLPGNCTKYGRTIQNRAEPPQ